MLGELKKVSGDLLGGSILEPRAEYRAAIGALGVALPPVVWIWAGNVQNSISAYYHTGARDWFVGTLWVIGVFLYFYDYRPDDPVEAKSRLQMVKTGRADRVLGKIAGISAVIVALLPTAPVAPTEAERIVGKAHGYAAAALFFALSLFPLVLFSQSRTRASLYKGCGWLMLLLLAAIIAYYRGPESLRQSVAPWRPVFILEGALIWTFGFSWFVKGLQPAAKSAARPVALEESA